MRKEQFTAFALSGSGALIAWLVSDFIKLGLIATGFFVGLIPALLFSNTVQQFTDSKSLKTVEKILFPVVVALIGFEVKLKSITSAPVSIWVFLISMVTLVVVFSWLISQRQPIGGFLGIGTAICGNSAIAALGSFYPKRVKEVGIAIGVINILSIASIVILPFLADLFGLNESQSGFLAGAGVQAMALALATGKMVGPDAEVWASVTKIARVALLSPALLLSFQLMRSDKTSKGKLQMPFYIWIFIGTMLLANSGILPADILKTIKGVNEWIFASVMVAVGLQLTRQSMATSGRDALFFGVVTWFFQIALILLFLKVGNVLENNGIM
ncbi:MAG: putative sulfate exporter family transporter [Thermaurantimonas sp.]